MRVILTRDSVHPGDDPPHHWDFTVDGASTLGELVDEAVNYPYQMEGSSWSIAPRGAPANETPIATVSMHWAAPRFTNEADRRLRLDSMATAPGELRLHFRWHPGTVPVEESEPVPAEESEPVPVEGAGPGPLAMVPLLLVWLLFEMLRWGWGR
ncbi:hypothetical protein ACFXPX_06920 [Kitasatospora sp. NPDC059146]|uniref:hypothetical protein n=1 Tax=unclassified Kitasatospora TaxID=2633591 RepID=UPI00369C8E37